MNQAQPYYGHGVALRPEYYRRVHDEGLPADWVELVAEHVVDVQGGLRFELVERLRRDKPVALHCTTLSIGSVDPLAARYLGSLGQLVKRVQPVWVSDHLAWASFAGSELELLPL